MGLLSGDIAGLISEILRYIILSSLRPIYTHICKSLIGDLRYRIYGISCRALCIFGNEGDECFLTGIHNNYRANRPFQDSIHSS